MTTDASVSVVIPTRDRLMLLRATLDSVLAQRGVDLEVVVVDDGSRQDLDEVLADIGDPRVRLCRHEASRGVAAARNAGVAAARYAWIAFCDDDDLWSPDKLSFQLAVAITERREWAYTGAVEVDADLRIVGGVPPDPPSIVVRNLERWDAVPAGASNVVVRRTALLAVGGFDPSLPHLDDWDMWLRLARHGVPAYVRSPLVAYRQHPGQRSLNASASLAEVRLFEERNGVTIDRAAFHIYGAEQELKSGRLGSASWALARSVRASRRPVPGALHGVKMLAAAVIGRRSTIPSNVDSWRRSATWLEDARRAVPS